MNRKIRRAAGVSQHEINQRESFQALVGEYRRTPPTQALSRKKRGQSKA